MTGRIHVVRSAWTTPARKDRKPAQRPRRRQAPHCVEIADRLTETAATVWADRWSAFYGSLTASLTGAASRKPVEERVGLLVVCLAAVLLNVAPPGVRWTADLRTQSDGSPRALLLTRDDPETRHVVPVRLEDRSLKIGSQAPLAITAPNAGMRAMRALADEMAAFFGGPTRAEP